MNGQRENGQQEHRRQESWKILLCLKTETLLVEHTPKLFETQFLFKMNMTISAPESDMTIQSHSVSQKEDMPYRVGLSVQDHYYGSGYYLENPL